MSNKRDNLMEALQETFPGIWLKDGCTDESILSGEGSYIKETIDGEVYEVEAFDYYNESEMYEFGVHDTLAKFLDGHGYYAECNDPGTYEFFPQ